MRVDETSRDREAEPGAAGAAVTRCFEAHERLEHGVALRGRNAGAPVVDREDDDAIVRLKPDAGGRAVVERVVDEIRDDSPQRDAIAEHDGAAVHLLRGERNRPALRAPVVDLGANEVVELDQLLRELACARVASRASSSRRTMSSMSATARSRSVSSGIESTRSRSRVVKVRMSCEIPASIAMRVRSRCDTRSCNLSKAPISAPISRTLEPLPGNVTCGPEGSKRSADNAYKGPYVS